MSALFASPFAIPIVAIVCAVGIPVIAQAWCSWAKHKDNCMLKESMVARGMSADEIERVIAAGDESQRG